MDCVLASSDDGRRLGRKFAPFIKWTLKELPIEPDRTARLEYFAHWAGTWSYRESQGLLGLAR